MTTPDEAKPLRSVERWNLGLGVAMVAACAVLWPQARVVGGVALGAGLVCANFFVIRWVGERMIVARSKGLLIAVLLLKMVALLVLCGLILRFAHVQVVAFLLGLSVFLMSIFATSIQLAIARGRAEAEAPTPALGGPGGNG